jgi:hypothetical protein
MTDDYMHEPVVVDSTGGVAFRVSAEAMRALTKATGRTMSSLLQEEDDEADRFQAIAFLELHRRAAKAGHLPDAGELWERAGLVDIEVAGPAAPVAADPLGAGSSPTSPPSAGTGG